MGETNINNQGRAASGGLLSWPLVLAGMKKTRAMALIMGIITWTVSFLLPLKSMLNIRDNPGGSFYPQDLTALGANPTLYFSFMFYAPFLTLYVFNFLNNRAGSDYYHGTPARRRTLCLSYFLAVTIWMAIILAVAEGISAVCGAVWSEYISLEFAHLFPTFLQLMVSSLLVEASVLIAMSVTGTLLTNLVAALLIIFLPQAVLLLIGVSIESLVPMLGMGALPAIFRGGTLNCVVGMMIGMFALIGSSELYSKAAVIYTFVLALVYLVIATALFVRRPSETAGRPALGEKLQSLIRVIIACLITVPAILTFSSTPADPIAMPITFTKRFFGHLTSEQWIAVLVFYLISLGSMIVYELITARRMPGWKRFFAGVLCILAVDAVWLGVEWGAREHFQKERVAPEEIESVEADGNVFSSILNHASQSDQSWLYKGFRITLKDPSVLELIAKRHDEAAQEVYPDSDGAITIYDRYGYSEWVDSVPVQINKKDGTVLKRYLNLKESDQQKLWQAYGETVNAEKLKALPTVSDIRNIYVEYSLAIDTTAESGDPPTSFGMDRSECLEIYDSYRKELQKLSAQEWLSILTDSASFSDNPYIFIDSKDVNESYRTAALPITDAFPETRKLLTELGGEEAANALNGVTVTTIGGADGPTSVFIAGKNGDAADGTQIIGGADGPTSIWLAGRDEDDNTSETDSVQTDTETEAE